MLFRSKYLDPSRDVIDIGANIGFFSVLAGRRLSTGRVLSVEPTDAAFARLSRNVQLNGVSDRAIRSEEHTSELQSLMRTSYAVFCLTQKIRPPSQLVLNLHTHKDVHRQLTT